MKKISLIIIVNLIIFSLTSCRADLYQQMIIKGFGIDKKGDEYQVSVRYASLDEENPEKSFLLTGESVYDAINQISLTSGKKPLYSSANYIICSKEVAEEGLNKSLDFFVRFFRAKPVVKLYIAKDTAQEIIEAKKDDKLIPSNAITDSTESGENQGKTVSSTVLSFIADTKSNSNSSLIPLIEIENEEYSCKNTAITRDYQYIDILDEKETQAYLFLNGNLQSSSFVIEDENENKITAEIQKSKVDTNTLINENKVTFDMKIKLTANLVAVPFDSVKQNFEVLQENLSNEIEKNIEDTIETYIENKVDFLGLLNKLYIENTDYFKEYGEDFFENCDIKITVNTVFTKIGEEDSPFYK